MSMQLNDVRFPMSSIIGFNLGVEAGQLVIVAVAMLVLWALRRVHALYAARVQTISAYAIGSISVMWLLQRVLPA